MRLILWARLVPSMREKTMARRTVKLGTSYDSSGNTGSFNVAIAEQAWEIIIDSINAIQNTDQE
jgi:hypothetical protein